MNPESQTAAPEPVMPYPVALEAAARKALAKFLPEQTYLVSEADLLAAQENTCGALDIASEIGVRPLTPRAKLLLRPFVKVETKDKKIMPNLDRSKTDQAPGVSHSIDHLTNALAVFKATRAPGKWAREGTSVRISHAQDVLILSNPDFEIFIAPRIQES